MSRRYLAEGSAASVGMAEARGSAGIEGDEHFISVLYAQLSFLWRCIIASKGTFAAD